MLFKWSVEEWLHFEKFWEASVVVVQKKLQGHDDKKIMTIYTSFNQWSLKFQLVCSHIIWWKQCRSPKFCRTIVSSYAAATRKLDGLGFRIYIYEKRRHLKRRLSTTHWYFTRLNTKRRSPFKLCLQTLLGIHRNSKQKYFFKSFKGFLR